MLIGYARTSTTEQVNGLEAQREALKAIGCDRLYDVERQPSWPVPTTTLAGGAGRKTGLPVWRAAPPA
ncbi:recombinase family protein [Sulfitobacter sp. M22298]|uniref:recombinase family protein n=1 Tax=Sulfitobacter sp. M22298 TaxID=3368575 RepID=UPI0037463F64